MVKILVRADDLGYSQGVNYGIAKTVIDGVVKSVGVMTNMPDVAHGLDLLKGHKVCFGQHTNVCAGSPLSDPKRIPSLVKEDGTFKTSKTYREAKESFVIFEEALIEIEAQYHRFVELIGEEPGYIEGHAVFDSILLLAIESFAKSKGIKYSGFSIDGSPINIGNSQVVMHMESMNENYEPFNILKNMVENYNNDSNVHMFISHPGYLDAYLINTSSLLNPRVYEVEMLTSQETKKLLNTKDVKQLSYDDL
jgi:predicted glycoside hydrolase/deacetylase ChbG (UPF0249 family)